MSAGAGGSEEDAPLFMLEEGSMAARGFACAMYAVGGEGGVGPAAARMLAMEGTWEGGGISVERHSDGGLQGPAQAEQGCGRHWRTGVWTHLRVNKYYAETETGMGAWTVSES